MAIRLPKWVKPGGYLRWKGWVGHIEDVFVGEHGVIVAVMFPKNILKEQTRADWLLWDNVRNDAKRATLADLIAFSDAEIMSADDRIQTWLGELE